MKGLDRKGIAFFLVFVLIAFTTAIIMALGIQVQNQARVTKVMKDKEIAFLIAQAGLKAVYYEEQRTNWSWFTHEPNALPPPAPDYVLPATPPEPTIALDLLQPLNLPTIDVTGNYTDNIMGGSFAVTAKQKLDDPGIVTIESTGTYNSQSVALTAVYKRELFNEYFIFTPYRTGQTSYSWTLDAGKGKIYIGGDLLLSSHGGHNGVLNVKGTMTVMGKIAEWSLDDTNPSADIEYYLTTGQTQKWVRRYYLGLDDTPYGDPAGPYPPPGFLSGTVTINGVPIRSPSLIPPISGACSDPSGVYSGTSRYVYPAWLNKASPTQNETYAHILGYDDTSGQPISVIPGVLRANIVTDFNQRQLERELAWQRFMADYVTLTRDNIFVNWSGTTTATTPHTVTPPNYDILAESAYIHIVHPLNDPGDDSKIVSAKSDIPGCVAIIDFYDPAYCYQEDDWSAYNNIIVPDENGIDHSLQYYYMAANPHINTNADWLSHHDGSVVGAPIRTVVIDVGLMVDDTQMVTPSITDKSVIHSEVPVILLGTPIVDKTFTFICEDNLYLVGDFNLGDPNAAPKKLPKSITLMTKTRGFYQSDTFASKNPFVINSYYTGPAKGTELQVSAVDPWFIAVSPRAPTHSDPMPIAVDTTQNALFIGLWNNTRENWCTGSVPLTREGAFITLDNNENKTPRTVIRVSSNEYDVASHKLYSGACINLTQLYCDAFYDNPAAGQIAGLQLLEWRID